jgi:hypothetical protein
MLGFLPPPSRHDRWPTRCTRPHPVATINIDTAQTPPRTMQGIIPPPARISCHEMFGKAKASTAVATTATRATIRWKRSALAWSLVSQKIYPHAPPIKVRNSDKSRDTRSKHWKASTHPSAAPNAIPPRVAPPGVKFNLRRHHGSIGTSILFGKSLVFRTFGRRPPLGPV